VKNVWVESGDTVEVSISGSYDTICSGIPVTLIASFLNTGTNPLFQWFINRADTNNNDSVLTYIPAQNDTIFCVVTSFESCRLNNPDTSNILVIHVLDNLPVVFTITASDNPVCTGDSVTFTGTSLNGGSTPTFQWKVNAVNAGMNNAVFTYIPANGDLVSCTLTNNEQCTTNNPAASNIIPMTVNPLLPVSITISPSVNPICESLPITFTAFPVNGGTNPTFQWKVNANNAGMNNAVFTYIPTNGDLVSCILTSSEQCTTNNPASSIPYPVSVIAAPVVTFTPCFDTITITNAKPIKLKGGIPLGGTYSGPGVNPVTGIFSPSAAGLGTKIITYSYTNAALCSASNTRTIVVQSDPVFTCGNNLTDIRDNKIYPTILIGTQCWMAANLNYGNPVSGIQHQWDNCIPEKYCYNNLPAPCALRSALYQWDELMQYDDTPGLQGLCPPGWHVPVETEWQTLFAIWTNNAFAGAPLKYSGYSGFNALLDGTAFFNNGWYFGNFAIFFWSSTSHGPWKAWSHAMNDYDFSVSYYPSYRANAFSVRCLKD